MDTGGGSYPNMPGSSVLIVGCQCGNSKNVSKEADRDYGQYHIIIECSECGYYWEGYMGYC